MNIDPIIHELMLRNPARKFEQWKKVQISVVNNTAVDQTINILQAVMNQSIRQQYPPVNTTSDVSGNGGNRTAMSQTMQRAYSILPSSSTLEVYDDQGTVVASISLSGTPRDVLVDDENGRVFVTVDTDGIDVINIETNTVSSTISTGGGSSPFGLTTYANGRIAVSLSGTNVIRVYDPATLTAFANFSTGSTAYSLIGYDPGLEVFLGKVGTGTLQRFNPSTLVNTLITALAGTISDIRYVAFASSMAVSETGGARDVYFYAGTTLVNTLQFTGLFSPRFISIDTINNEIMINGTGTTQVAFASISDIQAGSPSGYVTTTYANISGGYFSSETWIVINQATTDVTLLNRKSSVRFSMNGSQSEYDYLVNDIQYNPLLCFYIYLKVSNVQQISEPINLEISQATGITFIDPKYPEAYMDVQQSQPNYVLVPIDGFVFDGSDYIGDYVLQAGVSVTMVFYVRQLKRARLMNKPYLKRYFTENVALNKKINTFDTVQTFSGQEITPESIYWGAENNHLLERIGESAP